MQITPLGNLLHIGQVVQCNESGQIVGLILSEIAVGWRYFLGWQEDCE